MAVSNDKNHGRVVRLQMKGGESMPVGKADECSGTSLCLKQRSSTIHMINIIRPLFRGFFIWHDTDEKNHGRVVHLLISYK